MDGKGTNEDGENDVDEQDATNGSSERRRHDRRQPAVDAPEIASIEISCRHHRTEEKEVPKEASRGKRLQDGTRCPSPRIRGFFRE